MTAQIWTRLFSTQWRPYQAENKKALPEVATPARQHLEGIGMDQHNNNSISIRKNQPWPVGGVHSCLPVWVCGGSQGRVKEPVGPGRSKLMNREEKVYLIVSLIEKMNQKDREATVSFVQSIVKNKGCQQAQEGEN